MKPQPVERLEKTLARVAKEQGLAQEHLRRWVSFLALCGVLERAVSEGILDNYDLKGGVALELRFAEGARATKDIDIGVPVERTKRLRVFQDAVALGFDDFTFLLKGKPLNMDKVGAVRLELAYNLKICYPLENKLYNSRSPMPSSTHVPNQLHGYSLQFTECVSVLVDAAAGDSVSVEVLDDVALSSEGGKTGLIQTKAGTGSNPISDGALEMWKSFRNWIDQSNAKEIDPNKSTFTLYVGALHKGTLCSLMSAARTTAEVDDALKRIEAKFLTPTTKKFRKELGKEISEQVEVVLDPKNRKQLSLIVSKFDYRHGSGDSYVDLRSKFAKMAIQDSLLDLVMDRMAGWTKRCIDAAIENGKPPVIKVQDFRKELNSYHVKLINQPFLERFTEETLVSDHAQHSWKLYYRQLTLIEADSTELMEAVGNYLSARAHAVRYVREGIINDTSLPEYAKELHTLWMNLKKKWELQATTKGDVHFGKSLLNDCSLQKTKLQGGDVPTFFMCGCFHELADHLEIGWHPKFLELLGGGNATL